MVFHPLENRGQVNIDFILAVVLLAFVIISVVIITIRTFPSFTDQTKDASARSKAAAVESLLLYSPGYPPNWSDPSVVVILGLAYFNNRSNQTIYGALDPTKLSLINSSNTLNYSFAKNSLNLTDVDFYLQIRSDWGNLTYFNYTPTSSQRVISINKQMALINNSFKLNQTTANVTLLVWES